MTRKALEKQIADTLDKAIKKAVAARKGTVWVGNSISLLVRGGSAMWRFTYRDGDKLRTTSLGSYPDKKLNAAKKARNDFLAAPRTAGTKTGPAAPKPLAGVETFGDVLADYLAEKSPDWEAHERTDFRNMMDKAPALLALPANDVGPVDIADAVKGAYPDKPKRQAKFRRRIATVMTFIETRHVEKAHSVVHHPAMKLAELPAFMAELAALDSVEARALRFTILTAARSGEVLAADWSEIAERDGVSCWVHDRAHRKGRGVAKDQDPEAMLHYVPLTRQMLDCLGTRGEGLIFRSRIKGKGKLGHSVMNDLLTTLRPAVDDKGKPLCSVHGMRSTFRDWVTDNTDYDGDLGELALAHRVGSKSKQAYARSGALAKRLPMMQDWSDLLVNCPNALRKRTAPHLAEGHRDD